MNRIEYNVKTGKREVIELTQKEIDDAAANALANPSVSVPHPLKSEIDALKSRLAAVEGELKV